MSKARDWHVREATPQDDPALAELFRAVFGFDRGVAHAAWKFRANPAGDPVLAIAEVGDKIVGQYALWPTPLRLGGRATRGAQSLDTMTHPDYRGQGMFTVLAEECMKFAASRGIELLYGFPNENSQPGFVRRLDWDHTGDIPTFFRPLAISRHKRVPRWIGPLADGATLLLPRGSTHGVELRRGMPPSDQLAALFEACSAKASPCSIERSVERALWRFDAASGMRYQWVGAYRADRLCAVGVWGVDIRGGNALLAELMGTEPDASEGVLVSVLARPAVRSCMPSAAGACWPTP
jgi:GNAT superfamily N-acetyltransferase